MLDVEDIDSLSSESEEMVDTVEILDSILDKLENQKETANCEDKSEEAEAIQAQIDEIKVWYDIIAENINRGIERLIERIKNVLDQWFEGLSKSREIR